MRNIFLIFIFLLSAACANAQLPAGTRVQQVGINTNSGIFTFGSNSITSVTITNYLIISNNFRQFGGYTFTNDSPMVVSNMTTRGAVTVGQLLAMTPTYVSLSTITNSDYSVTSLSALIITNTSTTGIVFLSQDSASAATNRLHLLGVDLALKTNTVTQGSAEFIYNAGSASNNWTLRSIVY
jgi:hypothetical protein